MGIAMFVIFLMSDLFTVLICRYAMSDTYEYKNGMILGVHIPQSALESDEVETFLTSARKRYKYFQNINILFAVVVCIPILFNLAAGIFVWIFWLVIYIAGYTFSTNSAHRKMYRIKIKNGWINESSRRVYADTGLSSVQHGKPVSLKCHIFIMIFEVILFVPFLWRIREIYFGEIAVYFAAAAAVSLAAFLLHIFIDRRLDTVYSEDARINQTVNYAVKKYWGIGLVLLSAVNCMAYMFVDIGMLINGELNFVWFIIYIIIQMFSVAAIFITLMMLRKEKNLILADENPPVYVDDDEYWKTGYYFNPDDRHLLVQNRLCDTNYAFNYARPAARVIVGAITVFIAAAIIITAVLLIPFMNVTVNIELDDNYLKVKAAGYKCEISLDDIKNVELLEKMPEDNFTRTNGGSTDEYSIGYFSGRTAGKCMLFIFNDCSPVLKIETGDKTVFVNNKDSGSIIDLYNELK